MPTPDDAATRWRALGAALPELVTAATAAMTERWRAHVDDVLRFADVSLPEKTRARLLASDPFAAEPDPDEMMNGSDVGNHARVGALGGLLRRRHAELGVARCLDELWRHVESEHEGTADASGRWSMFWDELERSLDAPPSASDVAVIAGIGRALDRGRTDPTRMWPARLTDEREDERIERALAAVAERTGLPRDALPDAPERPARVTERDDFVLATERLHDWLLAREAWGHVLAALDDLLRQDRTGR